MTHDVLEPSLDLLRQEYVLVQAWKKTASYIRYHNWYSDTLELDWTTVNLPEFIAETAECLKSPNQWKSGLLRIVPAPKSQQWVVSNGKWEPTEETSTSQLRPLAYVSLRDQVVATALMLCLANRIETKQGDPRHPFRDAESRKKVSSYGNRLFCDAIDGELRHRWGSSKLYRSYFQDYRSFISRPARVAESIGRKEGKRIFIVESDLNQFYDRVRPYRLISALQSVQRDGDEPTFFDFAKRVFDWQWHPDDADHVNAYANEIYLEDFNRVALPQGLVSAGFFANAVLLAFDDSLRNKVGDEIAPGIRLEDTCRYVDDLRIVVTTDQECHLKDVEQAVAQWLGTQLELDAPGLELSRKKTSAAEFGGSEQPLVRQSSRMERIQSAVSGGFDAIGGEEILDAIQGLMRWQQAVSRETVEPGWQFSPLSDVRDETVARFSAGRFRTTYRSIRPLFEEAPPTVEAEEAGSEIEHTDDLQRKRTKKDLDEDARAFALDLVGRWVGDPSNVRLLRIGLDIWPDAHVLQAILDLLKPFTKRDGPDEAPRRVAWYCLAELLRAGATETGIVDDDECLPEALDYQQYRKVLCKGSSKTHQATNSDHPVVSPAASASVSCRF